MSKIYSPLIGKKVEYTWVDHISDGYGTTSTSSSRDIEHKGIATIYAISHDEKGFHFLIIGDDNLLKNLNLVEMTSLKLLENPTQQEINRFQLMDIEKND